MVKWRLILAEISRPLPLVSGIVVVLVQALTVAFTALVECRAALGSTELCADKSGIRSASDAGRLGDGRRPARAVRFEGPCRRWST